MTAVLLGIAAALSWGLADFAARFTGRAVGPVVATLAMLTTSAAALSLFLLWHGRRFGRAVPQFVDRGRSLGELVTSQASLYRAGGKRAFAAEHLERHLRHDFALAVGLPADATDDEIAARARVVGRDPAPALRSLRETRAARSDRALLAAVREGERARAMLKEAPPPEMRSTR